VFIEDVDIVQALQELSEENLRKLVRAFFASKISRGNVQPLHGVGEHGKDAVAVVDNIIDPLGRTQILLIQVKKGDVSLTDWNNRICGQMLEALNTLESQFPRGTSRDNPRRLLLFLSGELTPEAFTAISAWNRTQSIPVEVFNIFDICALFRKYGVKPSDFGDLLELAHNLSL
jgi:hypothetical protein